MATRRIGGTAAKGGFYWNLGQWEMIMVPKQGGILPGEAGERYLRVPIIGLLVVAPLMGALYAFFLPFIGFAMLFAFLGKKALAMGRSGAVEVAAPLARDWRPGEAYLASGKTRTAADAENGAAAGPASPEAPAHGTQGVEPRRTDGHD
jgi:hypothetical protein